MLQQTQKYWANNDEVKLADNMHSPAPIDTFKKTYNVQHSKFGRTGKVTEINHWKNTDKVADPELKNGFKPNLKWSEEENNFKCSGVDRPHRTFDKIVDHA